LGPSYILAYVIPKINEIIHKITVSTCMTKTEDNDENSINQKVKRDKNDHKELNKDTSSNSSNNKGKFNFYNSKESSYLFNALKVILLINFRNLR